MIEKELTMNLEQAGEARSLDQGDGSRSRMVEAQCGSSSTNAAGRRSRGRWKPRSMGETCKRGGRYSIGYEKQNGGAQGVELEDGWDGKCAEGCRGGFPRII